MEKICFNGLFETLSEKEMKNVIGGTVYGGGGGGGSSNGCVLITRNPSSPTCSGTCNLYDIKGNSRKGTCTALNDSFLDSNGVWIKYYRCACY